ncbi:hypothetical protein ACFL0W_04500 [Nanoarchaeota archaeon]
MANKKRLTQQQEFDIMKLVLDKFLWLGFAIMLYGMWRLFDTGLDAVAEAASIIVAGAILLVIFMIIIVKEYEIIK